MKNRFMTGLIFSAFFALIMTFSAVDCFADKAVVVLYRSGCDYFIAYGSSGYYLLEWYGGYDPSDDDVIIGPISSYGFHDVYYPASDDEGNIYVEDYWLSKSQALEEYIEHCQ